MTEGHLRIFRIRSLTLVHETAAIPSPPSPTVLEVSAGGHEEEEEETKAEGAVIMEI
jgi:hypothetical protein